MNSGSFITNEIVNSIDVLVRGGYAIDANSILDRMVHKGTNRISCERSDKGIVVTDYIFGSVAEYFALLNAGRYSVLLYDGGFVYLSYDVQRGTLVGHSLLYYPSLIDVPLDSEVPVVDFLEFILDEVDAVRLRSPIRIDFDPKAESSEHPRVHAHLNHGDCRIPVSCPLSPREFFAFILRSFYPKAYADLSYFRFKKPSPFVEHFVDHSPNVRFFSH